MSPSTYNGSCHCGANRFKITVPEIQTSYSCRCLACRKIGFLCLSVPLAAFEVERETLESSEVYTAGSVSHKFCRTCGTSLFVDHGTGANGDARMVNVRSLLGVNPFQLDILPLEDRFDTEHSSTGSLQESSTKHKTDDDGTRVYAGSCICGGVTVAVKTPPLADVETKEDNCSICVRNAFIGIYPDTSQVTISGREQTCDYRFGREFNGHPFCKTCGVHPFQNLYGPPKQIVESWPQARQDIVKKMLRIQPVNIRILEGVDWDSLKVTRSDEGTEGFHLAD